MPVLFETITPTESERQSAAEGREALTRLLSNHEPVRLQSADSNADIVLSESMIRLLHEVMKQFADGQAVTVVSRQAELSTIEAADLLGVSRPHLVKLLDGGEIACRRVGGHRRVPFDDLLRYREENRARRLDALTELQAQAQELGMGY